MTQADRGLYYTLVYHTFTAPNGPACCTRKARSAVTQPGTVANIIFITVVNIIFMSASFANVMIMMSTSIMSATTLAQCFTLPALRHGSPTWYEQTRSAVTGPVTCVVVFTPCISLCAHIRGLE